MSSAAPSLSHLRLLILSPVIQSKDIQSPFPPVLTHLTSISPLDDIQSFAGYTDHPPLALRTKYYSKNVSIWCDELPSDSASSTISEVAAKDDAARKDQQSEDGTLEDWKTQMLSEAAGEVRAVIGGIILVLPVEATQNSIAGPIRYIEAAHAFREAIEEGSPGRDIASVVILQPQATLSITNESSPRISKGLTDFATRVSNDCLDRDMFGWDVVSWTGRPEPVEKDQSRPEERNEFGEKTGMPRVIEVLESVDWSVRPYHEVEGAEDADPDDGVGILDNRGMSGLDSELQQEMLGLKLSMLDNAERAEDEDSGEDLSIEQMQSLKSRVLAIRETVAGMPTAEKEAVAKREIEKIMKEL